MANQYLSPIFHPSGPNSFKCTADLLFDEVILGPNHVMMRILRVSDPDEHNICAVTFTVPFTKWSSPMLFGDQWNAEQRHRVLGTLL
jgi:hypothetical protein